MDYMDESHEAYRKTFDFLETTNTWHDVDLDNPLRIPDRLKSIGCAYQAPSAYWDLAKRAQDGFMMVVKVSCIGTHIKKLQSPEQWWPRLYWEKYSKLRTATVAFLWQFPPTFRNDDRNWQRLVQLAEYLASPEALCPGARHIVDFRNGSWYTDKTYEFLRARKWWLACLHLNNDEQWAADIPSGWTDRVQTTDFVYMRLFGPDGSTHGSYDKAFLHQVFDSCPSGTTSYVLFGNREFLDDPDPVPRPAVTNAYDFRTIFSKMDLVTRIRDVRYRGECPRLLDKDEQLLLNSFYLRFALRARTDGVSIVTPCASAWATKYYPRATPEKRCFEWIMDTASNRRLHLSLHDIKEESDVWRFLRQVSGCEDMQAARKLISDAEAKASSKASNSLDGLWLKDGNNIAEVSGRELVFKNLSVKMTGTIEASWYNSSEVWLTYPSGKSMRARLDTHTGNLHWENGSVWYRDGNSELAATQAIAELWDTEKSIINGAFIRWSEKARQAGLLATTELKGIRKDNEQSDGPHYHVVWTLKRRTTTTTETKTEDVGKDDELVLSTRDLLKTEDIMTCFKMLSRMSDQTTSTGVTKKYDPWHDGKWKSLMGEMWRRPWTPKPRKREIVKKEGEKKEGESWDDLWGGGEKRAADEFAEVPQAKRFAKDEQPFVWARFPVDGEFYKARLEARQRDGTCEVAWANGHKGDNKIDGEDVFPLDDFPEGEDGRPMCKLCRNTGLDTYGQICECDHGAKRIQDQQEQEAQELQRQVDQAVWLRLPASTGGYLYKNCETGEVTFDIPPIMREIWEMRMTQDSSGRPQRCYCHIITGDVQLEAPEIPYEDENQKPMGDLQKRVNFLIKKNQRTALTQQEEKEVDELTQMLEKAPRPWR